MWLTQSALYELDASYFRHNSFVILCKLFNFTRSSLKGLELCKLCMVVSDMNVICVSGRAVLQKRIMALLRKIEHSTLGNAQVSYSLIISARFLQ